MLESIRIRYSEETIAEQLDAPAACAATCEKAEGGECPRRRNRHHSRKPAQQEKAAQPKQEQPKKDAPKKEAPKAEPNDNAPAKKNNNRRNFRHRRPHRPAGEKKSES